MNKKLIGFGTVDEELIDVGRLGLTAGRWPEKEFEIRDNTIAWTEEDPYRALDCAVRFEIRPEEADGVSLSWIMHQMSGVSTYVEDEWE